MIEIGQQFDDKHAAHDHDLLIKQVVTQSHIFRV